jgi:DNA polymerase alpha subunit B
LQAIVACGPFTVNNELSFEGLKDLMPVIKRERPQALIICGPFLPKNHKDIEDGDLKIYNTIT